MIINPPRVNAYKGPVYENWLIKTGGRADQRTSEWGDNRLAWIVNLQ